MASGFEGAGKCRRGYVLDAAHTPPMHRLATFGVAGFAVTILGVGFGLIDGPTAPLGIALAAFGACLLVITGVVAVVQIARRLWARRHSVPDDKPPDKPDVNVEGPVGSIGQSGGTTFQHNYPPSRGTSAIRIGFRGDVYDLTISGSRFHNVDHILDVEGSLHRPLLQNNVHTIGQTDRDIARINRGKQRRKRKKKGL